MPRLALSLLLQFGAALTTADFYGVLGVARDASKRDISAAFRRLSLRWHPDKNMGAQDEAERRMRELSEAYAVLADVDERRIYDMKLARQGQWQQQRTHETSQGQTTYYTYESSGTQHGGGTWQQQRTHGTSQGQTRYYTYYQSSGTKAQAESQFRQGQAEYYTYKSPETKTRTEPQQQRTQGTSQDRTHYYTYYQSSGTKAQAESQFRQGQTEYHGYKSSRTTRTEPHIRPRASGWTRAPANSFEKYFTAVRYRLLTDERVAYFVTAICFALLVLCGTSRGRAHADVERFGMGSEPSRITKTPCTPIGAGGVLAGVPAKTFRSTLIGTGGMSVRVPMPKTPCTPIDTGGMLTGVPTPIRAGFGQQSSLRRSPCPLEGRELKTTPPTKRLRVPVHFGQDQARAPLLSASFQQARLRSPAPPSGRRYRYF